MANTPAWFDEAYYLSSKLAQLRSKGLTQYQNIVDVKVALETAGYTPFSHFQAMGLIERTSPNQYFNATEYLNAKAQQANAKQGVTTWNADNIALAIRDAGMTIWEHFQKFGWKEGVNPSNAFDVNAYFESKLAAVQAKDPDGGWTLEKVKAAFEAAGLDPITHYVEYGKNEEGVTVSPAKDPVPSDGRTGVFTLTTGVDEYTGTDADDTFDAPLSRAGELPVSEQTLQGIDSLDGGAGRDTLNAHLNGFSGLFDAENPEIKNIEQYNLTVSADSAAGGLDLARASGYDTLQNIDSRGDLYLGNVNVSEDGKAPTIALTNVRGDTEVTYDDEVDSVSVQNVTASKVGLHDDDANLRIDVDSGRIETLNLNVSNGVYLDLEGDADRIQNLNISGSGILELEGNSDFGYLETLDSTKYTGDLDLDVSGSEVLESVKTGEGDDNVMVDNDAVDGDLVVDMGEGENALWIDEADTAAALSGLDFTGGVANVQTLVIDDDVLLGADATLDLTGFDENLSTVLFDEGLDGNGSELEVISPNADLTLASNGSFEDVDLHTNGITNLTVNVIDGNLDIDQLSSFEFDADAQLETLTLNQTSDAAFSYSALDIISDASHDVSNLQTITSTATGSASVEIDARDVNADVNSLTSVNVTSTGSDAELVLTGAAGVVYDAGVQQRQGFDIGVTGELTGNTGFPLFANIYRATGEITLANSAFPGGFVTIPYATTQYYVNNATVHTVAARNDIISGLNAGNYGFTASADGSGGILITWDDVGAQSDITIVPAGTHADLGTLPTFAIDPAAAVPGEAEVPMESGTGFEALTDVVVDAQDGDADVELTDVYGSDDGLTVNVTATENAWIDLYNTGVTSVTAAAAHVDIDAAGDTVGNSLLTTISVTSVSADITLEDNLVSFETLDVVNVSNSLVVDTSAADFGVLATGDFITYTIGATSDGIDGTTDVDFTGNAAAREVYDFAGGDIGEVVITGFTWGDDPVAGDRLDLSDFASNAGQLVFSNVGADLVITDLNGGFGDFGGSITIIGAAGQGLDVAQFNIIYA